MDANTWTLIILVGLMALCCLPMLFMRRRNGRSPEGPHKTPHGTEPGPKA